MFFFSVLQGCETELERLFQGVLGYALLVILGFAIIKVKFVIISEANLNQFLTRCLHHAGNKLTNNPFVFEELAIRSVLVLVTAVWNAQRVRDLL